MSAASVTLPTASERARASPSDIGWKLALALAALLFLGVGLFEAWNDAPTEDESIYIASGVSALVLHDVRINDEHPPLDKVLAALPVLLAQPVVPRGRAWVDSDEGQYERAFFRAQTRAGKLREVVFLARIIPLLETIAVAFAIDALSRRLFTRRAGLFAAILWLANPLTLGIGHLDGVDIPFALATLLVSLALLRWRHGGHPDAKTGASVAPDAPARRGWAPARPVLVLGGACGVALLVGSDALLVVGSVTVVMLVTLWRRRRLQSGWPDVAWVLFLALAVVWLGYFILAPGSIFHGTYVFPRQYLGGLHFLAREDTVPGPAYLLGTYWVGGRWWYWAGSLLVKTPTPTLVVLVLGPLALVRLPRRTLADVVAVLVLPAAILTLFTLALPRDIGVRYLLPSLALWLVVISPLADSLRRPAGQVILALVVVGDVVLTAASVPNTIAWTMPPFRPAYQVATDSDVDWGQGYYLLSAWSVGKNPWIAYFGPEDQAPIAGSRVLPFDDPGKVRGWVAVSVTLLTAVDDGPLSWLRAYCPTGVLGGSILVYDFTTAPSHAPGPAKPASVCSGRVSHRTG